MDQSLYSYSLCAAIPLMLFFGFHMLLARTPDKKIYSNFLLSRRLMGIAMLVLTANYCVHFFCTPRVKDVNATIMMNLVTYFISYWLFSSALMTLLDNRYITRRRFLRHVGIWIAFAAVSSIVLLFVHDEKVEYWGLLLLAAWLVSYGLFLSVRLLRTYYRAIKMLDNTHSDDIGAYIKWLSIFTFWALGFGVSCGLLTFLPNNYVFIWIISAIPFYVYLYCCYHNYALSYEKVETAIQEDMQMTESANEESPIEIEDSDAPIYHNDISRRIKEWIGRNGYCKPGLTLKELSLELCTNRTYLSEYIHTVYNISFREWIADLRIEHAKQLMKDEPQLKLLEISEACGFLSISHFTRTFNDKEGSLPSRWRKTALMSDGKSMK